MTDICKWHLEFSFKEKERVVEFLRILMDQDIDFPFSYQTVFDETVERHVVMIDDMSWAGNLTTAAKILEGVDFKEDE